MNSQEISEEDRQTLFVFGISKDVDEEILYELFLNAGPLFKVNIPMDHNTKQKKNFAFVRFQHEESVKYAVELFRGIKLFGQSLSMQNRKTGVGVQQNRHQNDNGQRMQTHRSNSMPNHHQQQPQFSQDQQQSQYQQQYSQQQYSQQQQYAGHQNAYQQSQGFQQPRSYHDRHDPYYRRDNNDRRDYQNDRSRQGQHRNFQEERRHHSHDRDDRNAPPQHYHDHEYRDRSREFRDRSHDRRQYDDRQQNRHRRF
eukprot:04774.XXX_103925_105205_1 [CDS] Oithona nana genome sequencing.